MSEKTSLKKLNQEEIQILMEIQENPLATFEELADATGYPKTRVYRIVKKLEDISLKPPYFKIVAIPDLNNLGLEHLNVLVEAETQKELKKCVDLCEEHPYIWYYAKCYGKVNGMFIQFRIPFGNVNLINDLFNLMKTNGWIRNSEILHFKTGSILSKPKVENWDINTLSWNFNWKKWFNRKLAGDQKQKQLTGNSNLEEIKSWLQKRDIAILAELLRNMRRKNKTMIQSLKKRGWNLSPQTFSRRLKKIQKYLVQDNRAEIHHETFDLLTPILIWGFGDKVKLEEIQKRIIEYPIPFHSTFKVDDYKLYWYLHISTTKLSDLLEILRPMLHNFHFYFIDYPRSKTFLPDYKTYNEDKGCWKQSENYLVYDQIRKLKDDE